MSGLKAGVLALLLLSFLAAAPAGQAIPLPAQGGCAPRAVHCIPPPYAVPAAPVWATLNAPAQANYPGGDEQLTVFFLNSDSPPLGNVTLLSETLRAPFQNATVSGLPVELAPGQALISNITLQIPSDFSQSNFTASITIDFHIANATASIPTTLVGNAQVFVLGPPIQVASTSSTTSTQQTTTQSGTFPTSLFYASVGVPSLVAIVLLVLLMRDRKGHSSASPGTPASV